MLKGSVKGFVLWLIPFVLSFVIQFFGSVDQGTAFLWLTIGAVIVLCLMVPAMEMTYSDGLSHRSKLGETVAFFLLVWFCAAVMMAVLLLMTWVVTWLMTRFVTVSFTTVYQAIALLWSLELAWLLEALLFDPYDRWE